MRRRSTEGKLQPSRQSPRLRERRDWNQQSFKDEEGRPEASLANPETQKSRLSPLARSVVTSITDLRVVKRRRSIPDGDLSNDDAKRPKIHDVREQSKSRIRHGKNEFIESWLSTSGRSRRTSVDNEPLLHIASDNMPRKTAVVLPSPRDSGASTALVSSSRASDKSAASTRDTDYRDSLRYRNIYIEREDPPMELMQRAKRVISRSRASPEMDDATAQELRITARRLQNEGEEDIVQQLAPYIIPAMVKAPDQRLARNADQPWFNHVPVPLNPNVLTNPLPLPKPKPDLAFGYSEAAFTEKQLMTIDLLVDDNFGRSYAVPDKKLRFPFLDVDFKSQAKNGTHYIATNQAAGAGAVALNGNLELIYRSFGVEKLDYNEPQFFSVTMDHELARINVHWLRAPAEGGQHKFHIEGLSKHLLDDANGIRAVVRAVKNILEYGSDTRLQKLCEALDAYRKRVILEREAATTEKDQGHLVQTEPRKERQRRGRPQGKPSLIQRQPSQRRPEFVETATPPEEDWADEPLENQYSGRGSRRMRTTAGRPKSPERRNRTNFPVKTPHNLRRTSARAARVTEYKP